MIAKALENFAAGVIGTLAFASVMWAVLWAMISILEYFRPLFGVGGALAAFTCIASVVVGIVCFVSSLTKKPE